MNPVGLFLIALVTLGAYFWYRAQPAEKRFTAGVKVTLLLATLALLYLTITGKLHWIGGLVALILPFMQKLIPWLLRLLPLLRFWNRNRANRQSGSQQQQRSRSSSELSEAEALKILGLAPGASREQIVLAHRKLMQKVHPDQGGNDWLASRINAAKDRLLK